jgi:hypothetical protein
MRFFATEKSEDFRAAARCRGNAFSPRISRIISQLCQFRKNIALAAIFVSRREDHGWNSQYDKKRSRGEEHSSETMSRLNCLGWLGEPEKTSSEGASTKQNRQILIDARICYL